MIKVVLEIKECYIVTIQNIVYIATIAEAISQIAGVCIVGTWIAVDKLDVGKHKETHKKAQEFIKNVYNPFRNITVDIHNIDMLNKDKNVLYAKNNNIIHISFEHLSKPLQDTVKHHLYKNLLRQALSKLIYWCNDIDFKLVNKKLLFKEIKPYYKWIIVHYYKKLSQINYQNQTQAWYNLYKEVLKKG